MKSIKVFNKFNQQRCPNKLSLQRCCQKKKLYAEKMSNDEKYIDGFV